jgi:hypothetical protein
VTEQIAAGQGQTALHIAGTDYMTLLTRLAVLEPFDTWPDMELAAEERFWDGLALATCNPPRTTGAVYSLGYAAEMLLKVAYFRVTGVGNTQDLGSGPLASVRTRAAWHGRNLHDLQGWVGMLIETRRTLGIPFDPAVVGQILWFVLTVDSHWREILRYKQTSALDEELKEVYLSVEWLLENRDLLWS